MKDEAVIGIIYRHGRNDYEFYVTDFDEGDEDYLSSLITTYCDELNVPASSHRGDKRMTLEDVNIDYWENEWSNSYRNAFDPDDLVSLEDIFKRYVDINGTHKGFEEYVDSGFMNGNEVEYIKL